jgi:hypothetical protein
MTVRTGLIGSAIALCGGCSSGQTIELDGVADFGEVQDSQWVVAPAVDLWTIDTTTGELGEIGPSAFDQLNMYDYAWSCADGQDELSANADLGEQLIAALPDGGNVADACDEMTALDEATAAAEDARPDQRHVLIAGYASIDPVEQRTYSSDGVGGMLTYRHDLSGCAAWDAASCSFVETGACESESWVAVDATLDVRSVGDVVTGTFDGSLVSETSTPAGEIHVAFAAPTCEFTGVRSLVLY